MIFLKHKSDHVLLLLKPLQCLSVMLRIKSTPLILSSKDPSTQPLPASWLLSCLCSPHPQCSRHRGFLWAAQARPAHSCSRVSARIPSPYFLAMALSHPSNFTFNASPQRGLPWPPQLARHSLSNTLSCFSLFTLSVVAWVCSCAFHCVFVYILLLPVL